MLLALSLAAAVPDTDAPAMLALFEKACVAYAVPGASVEIVDKAAREAGLKYRNNENGQYSYEGNGLMLVAEYDFSRKRPICSVSSAENWFKPLLPKVKALAARSGLAAREQEADNARWEGPAWFLTFHTDEEDGGATTLLLTGKPK